MSLTRFLRHFLCCALLFPLSALSLAAHESEKGVEAPGEVTLCHVCRVHEGETEAERVRATAEYEGETHGFCSPECRDKFLEDPVAYLPPVFPRPAPDFVALDLEGAEVGLDAYRGKTVLLDFWATWCPPCVKDLPKLTELHERYREQGLEVLSVSIDEGDDAQAKVERMIKRRKARHPVLLDATATPAWAAYHVRSVPIQFLIDDDGQIVDQWSGEIDLDVVGEAIQRSLEDGAE